MAAARRSSRGLLWSRLPLLLLHLRLALLLLHLLQQPWQVVHLAV